MFTRGLTEADALFDWMNKTSGEGFAAAGNKLTRSTGAITAIVEQRRPAALVVARGRLPGALDRARISASGNDDPLTEELEVAHHGFP